MVSPSNLAPNGVITMNMIKDSMFNEEARRKEQCISFHSKALLIERQGKVKGENLTSMIVVTSQEESHTKKQI